MSPDLDSLDTERIKSWRSIVTLIVFVVTNIIVLFPFKIPIFVPRKLADAFVDALVFLRFVPPRHEPGSVPNGLVGDEDDSGRDGKAAGFFVRLNFPMNFMTAPLIADLFLLAILAIGRDEVHDGTIGANHIHPLDIMIFFITLAYIAISIDASGLIRYLAFRVLKWGGKVGHRLFFYLYTFFFVLGSFIGNDPIILSGTAFLAYMTRVSRNIMHPRAWIYTQFAVANIASAILVSSNPTNLVLAGAFSIRFIDYTANMIVPVIITAVVLFPFLLFIVFNDESLIPSSIEMHELPDNVRDKSPVNPNIPHARGTAGEEEGFAGNGEQEKLLSLEEIMNPFLDKRGAAFGAVIMAATLITVLAINAASTSGEEQPVYRVTVPAAFLMLCWDLAFGWLQRHETRQIAREGRKEIEEARARRANMEEEERRAALEQKTENVASPGSERTPVTVDSTEMRHRHVDSAGAIGRDGGGRSTHDDITTANDTVTTQPPPVLVHAPEDNDPSDTDEVGSVAPSALKEKQDAGDVDTKPSTAPHGLLISRWEESVEPDNNFSVDVEKRHSALDSAKMEGAEQAFPTRENERGKRPATLASLVADAHLWCQETFPTVMAVLTHLPLALVPFAFAMFVLVQALVSSGWVPVFAYGWSRWVEKTGTVGAIGGMGFLSVVLCNFSGTNIGTTILLCRVVQAWTAIAETNGMQISNRTFWATVYSMALGVNYGAFSTAFSASLAGLLWRDILARKHIHVREAEFARINLPIIAISMTVGCVALIGEIYITRDENPYVEG